MLHLFYNAIPREVNVLNASSRHGNNEDNYGNRRVGNRSLNRSEQAYYLEKKEISVHSISSN